MTSSEQVKKKPICVCLSNKKADKVYWECQLQSQSCHYLETFVSQDSFAQIYVLLPSLVIYVTNPNTNGEKLCSLWQYLKFPALLSPYLSLLVF
jgi:ssDNA-specific exonuclease RecJ